MKSQSAARSESTCSYPVWAEPNIRELATQRWHGSMLCSLEDVPERCEGLIVVGGGRMMDEAKYFRARRRPAMRLILVPSLWGSGAERSPIVLLNRDGVKKIESAPEFLPDEVVYWPELLRSLPADLARYACGDVWAHALEAFLSPLAGEELRSELARLIGEMLRLPLSTDAEWFDKSGRACQLQAKASVGLVHGIAHVLEGPITVRHPEGRWGHAKLCAVFLRPAMDLNRRNSPKWTESAARYGIDVAAVDEVLGGLHERAAYLQALPLLKEHWARILRDPCTRVNGTMVRAAAIEFFEEYLGR